MVKGSSGPNWLVSISLNVQGTYEIENKLVFPLDGFVESCSFKKKRTFNSLIVFQGTVLLLHAQNLLHLGKKAFKMLFLKVEMFSDVAFVQVYSLALFGLILFRKS